MQAGRNANPFEPPKAVLLSSDECRDDARVAGIARRFGTLFVDSFGLFVSGLTFGRVIEVMFGASENVEHAILGAPGLLIWIASLLAYYILFESIWGRTPGKFVFGTKVVRLDGGPASLLQIVQRTLSRMIPFEAFSFLGSRGWHDQLSKTKVVLLRTSRARQTE